jgi:hypothetical protein
LFGVRPIPLLMPILSPLGLFTGSHMLSCLATLSRPGDQQTHLALGRVAFCTAWDGMEAFRCLRSVVKLAEQSAPFQL